ncbi:MAG: DUF2182 domain-containing protein [Gammaproteobacteria bacterium]
MTLTALRRQLAWLALAAIAALAWAFLVASEEAMRTMQGDGPVAQLMWLMMRPGEPLPYIAAAAVMWVVMMIAMMIPAVVPMAIVHRQIYKQPRRNLATGLFASGYLAGWSAFALLAAPVQWALHAAGWLHGMMLSAGTGLGGGLLMAAGFYQLTPAKEACLSHCRSPLGYFLGHWRNGLGGSFRMGLAHGLYCIGCCWVLMVLMFVGGAMSVVTMVLLAGFILAERLLPAGPWVARLPGLAMIAAGAWLWLAS